MLSRVAVPARTAHAPLRAARALCTPAEGLVALSKRANDLLENREFDQASAHLRRALEDCNSLQRENRSEVDSLVITNNLAHALSMGGRENEATELFKQALADTDRLLARDEPHAGLASSELLRSLVDAPDARAEFSRMLETMRLGVLDNLAETLAVERPAEACEFSRRALAAYEQVLGADHEETLGAANNLGCHLRNQGELADARANFERAHSGLEASLGELHPATLNALDNVGTVLLRQGEHVEALRVHERALAGRESALGADHADTLESANHVGCERHRNLPPRPRPLPLRRDT